MRNAGGLPLQGDVEALDQEYGRGNPVSATRAQSKAAVGELGTEASQGQVISQVLQTLYWFLPNQKSTALTTFY